MFASSHALSSRNNYIGASGNQRAANKSHIEAFTTGSSSTSCQFAYRVRFESKERIYLILIMLRAVGMLYKCDKYVAAAC